MAQNGKTDRERNESFEAPEQLVRALNQLQSELPFVPRTVDEAILRAAHKHLSRPVSRRRRWFVFVPAFGIPTVLLLTLIVWLVNQHRSVPSQAREDLNHDGQVDILDAFALARELKAGTGFSPAMDLNGDGHIDNKDVELIAADAVKLKKAGRS